MCPNNESIQWGRVLTGNQGPVVTRISWFDTVIKGEHLKGFNKEVQEDALMLYYELNNECPAVKRVEVKVRQQRSLNWEEEKVGLRFEVAWWR